MKRKILLALFVLICTLSLVLGLASCGSESTPDDPQEEEESCEINGHKFGDRIEQLVQSEPTCTEDGRAFVRCLRCDENVETTLPKLGHIEKTISGTPATCTTDGTTDEIVCERCDEVLVASTEIPAGHILSDTIVIYSEPQTNIGGTLYIQCSRCNDYERFLLPDLSSGSYTTEETDEGILYSCKIEGIKVEFIKYYFYFSTVTSAGREYAKLTSYNGNSENVVIPATSRDGLPVVEIGEKAFFENGTMISVTIPDSVEVIGKSAFAGCAKLKAVDLPSNLREIGEEAFYRNYSIKEITISENVTSIGNRAFANCSSLETVVLLADAPASVFVASTSIKSLTIKNCDDFIGNLFALRAYYSSEDVNPYIPESLKEIICYNEKVNMDYFAKCPSIENLKFPNAKVFEKDLVGCTNIKTIVLSDELTEFNSKIECINSEFSEYKDGLYIGSANNPYMVLVSYVNNWQGGGFVVNDATKFICTDTDFWNVFSTYSLPVSLQSIRFKNGNLSSSRNIIYAGTVLDWIKIKGVPPVSTITFSDGRTNDDITEIELDETFNEIPTSLGIFILTKITLPNTITNISWMHPNIENVYYKGTAEEWFNNCLSSYAMRSVKHVYFYDDTIGFYEPTVIELSPEKENMSDYDLFGFAKLEKIIIGANIKYLYTDTFNASASYSIYYKGTAEQWANVSNGTYWSEKLDVYFYSEDEQTVKDFLKNPEKRWHYNSDNEPEAWITLGNTVENKTYGYSSTIINVTDDYWAMLMELKRNNMLEELFPADPIQIEMIYNSRDKAEYVQKLTEFSMQNGADITVSFANGKMTLSQNGTIVMDYIEINGCIYVNVSGSYNLFYTINSENNTIYEEDDTGFVYTKHIWALLTK